MSTHTKELPTFGVPADPERPTVRSRSMLVLALLLVAALASAMQLRHRDRDTVRATRLEPIAAEGTVASLGRRASHGHRYHAEVVSRTPLAVGGAQSWTVRLTRRGHRRVAGARLAVRTWAPETGAVSPNAVRVRYVGAGRYRIDGLAFPRPGWWNVALVIDAAAGTDSVAFNVVLPAVSRPDSE